MIKFRYVDGCLVQSKPVLSSTKFPKNDVEPDGAYTIRKIYDCWIKGKPTSPHIFDCEFDEEGDNFDNSEAPDDFTENPIDRSQVLNTFEDAREQYEYESAVVAKEKKRRALAVSAKLRQPDDVPSQPKEDK